MHNVTPWPDSFDTSQPVARVLVDGRDVDVESVSVSSELSSAMPERVTTGGGIMATTGMASILRAVDVSEAGLNPWGDAQRLVSADEVVVEAGYRDPGTGEVGCAQQIVGHVEALGGGATENSVRLDFVDRTTLLDRDITIEPLLAEYPPLDDYGPRRSATLMPIYVTDRILRHCGFYATPPRVSGAVVSAPMMGSAWPERGTLASAWANTDANWITQYEFVPWGVALGDGVVSYAPSLGSRTGRLTSTMHVSFLRPPSSDTLSGSTLLELRWGGAPEAISVRLLSNNTIVVRVRSAGSSHDVVTLPAVDVQASEAFSVLVAPSGRVTLYASNGAIVQGDTTIPSSFTDGPLTEVWVRVPDGAAPLGGLQVAFNDQPNHMFRRSAHIDPPTHIYSLAAFPSKVDANCLGLLKEHAEAELAAMWIDEFGDFRWRTRGRLNASTPVGTLTSKDNLLDLKWSLPIRSVYSQVDLDHDAPLVNRRGVASITVSDSRGSTLSNGDTEDRFFEPPANQDWHGVATPQWMGGTIDYNLLKRGRGSYYGGIVVDHENEERLAYSSRLSSSWHRIGVQKWLLSSSAQDLTGTEYIEQSFRDRPDLYGRFAGENLPLVRAKGVVEWENRTTTGAPRGPASAPVFTHKVGPWIQGVDHLNFLADWLAEQLTQPSVMLRDVPIVPDPRIQLGDVFWLQDDDAYHVRLRVVVLGKTLTFQATDSGPEMSQTITCRIIAVERLHGATYAELEALWDGQDYAALDTAWAGQDYDALESDPLGRS